MPAAIIEDPLGIDCVFSDGATARFDLDGLPNPRLARDLLVGLVELIHPHATVDAAGSVGHYAQSIRDMTRTLAATGFTGTAADLRRARLAEYWIGASGPREACTRRMLHAFHAVTGDLAADVAELAAGRVQSAAQPPPVATLLGGRVGPAGPDMPHDHRPVVCRAPAGPGSGRARATSTPRRVDAGEPALAFGPAGAGDQRGLRGRGSRPATRLSHSCHAPTGPRCTC